MELPPEIKKTSSERKTARRTFSFSISPVPSPRPIGQSNAEEGEGNDGGKQQVGRDIPAQPVRQQARETGEEEGTAGIDHLEPPDHHGVLLRRGQIIGPYRGTHGGDGIAQSQAEDIDHAECRTLDKGQTAQTDAQPAEPRQTAQPARRSGLWSPHEDLPTVIITPVPLIISATVAGANPSEVYSTDRWEKPGLATAPINKLAQPSKIQVRLPSAPWEGDTAVDGASGGISVCPQGRSPFSLGSFRRTSRTTRTNKNRRPFHAKGRRHGKPFHQMGGDRRQNNGRNPAARSAVRASARCWSNQRLMRMETGIIEPRP